MAFLVNSRSTNNVFGEDLWGKMIKNEANYGQLFSIDWLYSKNFDDNFKFYTTHADDGTVANAHNVSKYTNDNAGKTQAKADWDGGYTNNPYPYDNINYVAHDNAIAEGINARTWNVHRKNPSLKPHGFDVFAYTEDIGLKPVWSRRALGLGGGRGYIPVGNPPRGGGGGGGGSGRGRGRVGRR